MIVLIIVLVVVVLIALYFMSSYNSLVNLRNKVKDAWSQIDVVLKNRNDLIPNLVECVKGYAKHEKETLNAVIEARNKINNAKTNEEEMKPSSEM